MLLYFIALSVHFITNEHSLREHHEFIYDHYGRWLLAFGIFIGGILGEFFSINEQFIGLLFYFLAGSLLLNVMKEELPEERDSSFFAFIGGLACYAGLLLFT